MKTKWLRRSAIIVGVIVLVTLALIVSWKLWFDPYRGTVTAFSPTMGLDAVFTSAQALEFGLHRCPPYERHQPV